MVNEAYWHQASGGPQTDQRRSYGALWSLCYCTLSICILRAYDVNMLAVYSAYCSLSFGVEDPVVVVGCVDQRSARAQEIFYF